MEYRNACIRHYAFEILILTLRFFCNRPVCLWIIDQFLCPEIVLYTKNLIKLLFDQSLQCLYLHDCPNSSMFFCSLGIKIALSEKVYTIVNSCCLLQPLTWYYCERKISATKLISIICLSSFPNRPLDRLNCLAVWY